MHKVVLDSSILVSAFLSQKGVNSLVVQKGKDEYHLYLSKDILDETSDVLLIYERIRRKYHYTDNEVKEYLKSLRAVAKKFIKKTPKIKPVIKEDPKDDFIIACALKTKADYIVSKDDHLKDLKEYRGIKIVSTQEFLDILKQKPE